MEIWTAVTARMKRAARLVPTEDLDVPGRQFVFTASESATMLMIVLKAKTKGTVTFLSE